MPLHVVFITFSRQVLRWQTSAICRVVPGAQNLPKKSSRWDEGDTQKNGGKIYPKWPKLQYSPEICSYVKPLNLKKSHCREAISLDLLCCKKQQKKPWFLPIEQLRLSPQRSQEAHVLSASSDQLFQVITWGWIDLSREGFNCWVFSQRTAKQFGCFSSKAPTKWCLCLFFCLFCLLACLLVCFFVCLFFLLMFPSGQKPSWSPFLSKAAMFSTNSELASSSLLPCATTTGTSWISSWLIEDLIFCHTKSLRLEIHEICLLKECISYQNIHCSHRKAKKKFNGTPWKMNMERTDHPFRGWKIIWTKPPGNYYVPSLNLLRGVLNKSVWQPGSKKTCHFCPWV